MSAPHQHIPPEQEIIHAWRQGALGRLIEETLNEIVGTPLADIGRAGDLIWLGFGHAVAAPTQRDPARRLARYRLHIQCPMRLDGPDGPVVGATDIYRDPARPVSADRRFVWDRPGANLYDVRVATLLSEQATPLVVESLSADVGGTLRLTFPTGYALTVLPNTAEQEEHWRYFHADNADSQLAVLPSAVAPA